MEMESPAELVRSKGDEVEIQVKATGIPLPAIVLIDNRGKEIPRVQVDNGNERIVATEANGLTKLKIKRLEFGDSGRYEFYGNNGHQERKQFVLMVKGNLELK